MYVYPVLHFHVWIFLFKYCNLPFYWRKLLLYTCTGWVYNMTYCIFFIYYFSLYTYISSKYLKKKKGFTELNSLSCIHVYLYIVNKILFLQFLFQNSAKPWDQEEAAGGLVCPGAGLPQAEQILQCRCDRDSVCAPVL